MSDNQLDTVVKTLVDDIQNKLGDRIEKSIIVHVKNALAAYDFENKITLLASLKLDSKISSLDINSLSVESKLSEAADKVIDSLANQARKQILSDIARKIDGIDFHQSITNAVAQQVEARLRDVIFPNNSIAFQAIKFDEIAINGDQVSGGIIKNFGSTGIDDRATDCRVTILDTHTVFENTLLAAASDIKGDLTVGGNLIIAGTMNDGPAFQSIVDTAADVVLSELNQEFFENYGNIVFDRIRTDGVDLNRITVNGEELIAGNRLGTKVTDSNLQRLGVVRDLQSQGETLLSETIYVANKRVGINTVNPGHALSIWDQEIEIVASKHSQNTALLGTARAQKLVLSSNGKDNLVLNTDGSVETEQISIGQTTMSSRAAMPSDQQPRGTIVWNTNPEIGQPIGWVSLGSARWAGFGTIAV
jgi:hypothetical protein